MADKITAWHKFRESRQTLQSGDFPDTTKLASNLVSVYKENRLIYAELDHYRDTGKVLGQHPLFKVYNEVTRFREMNFPEKVKFWNTLEKKIREVKRLISAPDKPELQEERTLRLQHYQGLKSKLENIFTVM